MKKDAISVFSPFQTLSFPVAGLALVCFLDGPSPPASAQAARSVDPTQTPAFAPAAIAHAQNMASSETPTVDHSRRQPSFQGSVSTTIPAGRSPPSSRTAPTFTALNPFFQNLGTNGRTCFSCHQPQEGWTVSAAGVQAPIHAGPRHRIPIFRSR